jgi:heme/copper-type cytochrome/quinol oxidase subunit 3
VSASTPPEGPEVAAGLSIHSDPGAARADDVRQLTGNLMIGSRLFASGIAFLFMSFLFAFFYLRAVNSNGLWRPKGVEPVQAWGIAVLVFMILTAVLFDYARRELVGATEPQWRTGAIAALVCGILVVIAQGIEYSTITFKTDQGGWASVFWGWTVVQLLCWLGAVYWVETLVAQTLRRPPASPREGTAGTELLRPSADAAIVYLYTMVTIGVIAYVLLYIIK